MVNSKWVQGSFLALALGLVAASSSAESHTVSGAVCQLTTAKESGDVYNQFGYVRATTLSNKNILCPLVVDHANGGSISSVLATVYARHPSINLSCTLIVTDLAGNAFFSQNQQASGTTASGSTTFSWTPSPSAAYGVISCLIPRQETSTTNPSAFTSYIVQGG